MKTSNKILYLIGVLIILFNILFVIYLKVQVKKNSYSILPIKTLFPQISGDALPDKQTIEIRAIDDSVSSLLECRMVIGDSSYYTFADYSNGVVALPKIYLEGGTLFIEMQDVLNKNGLTKTGSHLLKMNARLPKSILTIGIKSTKNIIIKDLSIDLSLSDYKHLYDSLNIKMIGKNTSLILNNQLDVNYTINYLGTILEETNKLAIGKGFLIRNWHLFAPKKSEISISPTSTIKTIEGYFSPDAGINAVKDNVEKVLALATNKQ